MSSESVEDSTTLPSSTEELDVYTNPNSDSILQADVVFSSSVRNPNSEEEQAPAVEADEPYFETKLDDDAEKNGNDSSRRLFLVLHTLLFLSIVFLVVATVRYIRVKRISDSMHVAQDGAAVELLSPVEQADPNRNPDVYRSHIEEILLQELHEECSTNFLEGPQKMAIDWLVYEDLVLNSTLVESMANGDEPTFPLVQKYALMVLFFGTSGELWSGQSWNRMAEVSECKFMGIECDLDDRITIVDLGYRKLRGRLPEEVGMLTNLYSFSVISNSLEGTIPSFIYNRLTDLNTLDLSKNNFASTISPEISMLSNLQVLHLMELVSLTGEIPVDAMRQLTSLEHLVITFAQNLRGPLLEASSSWTNLNTFDVYLSGFTGTIPKTIGQSANLEYLWLEGVQMDASTIPSEIGLLTNLKGFILDSKSPLDGATIPTEIGALPNLEIFGGRGFTGSIPTEIAHLANLQELILEAGSLTGNLPSEIGVMTNLSHLRIVLNEIEGTLPSELGNLQKLELLEVYFNNLTGSIPSGVCKNPDISIDRDCIQECECCGTKCRYKKDK